MDNHHYSEALRCVHTQHYAYCNHMLVTAFKAPLMLLMNHQCHLDTPAQEELFNSTSDCDKARSVDMQARDKMPKEYVSSAVVFVSAISVVTLCRRAQ